MADTLARRMADNQIRMCDDELKSNADRLASTTKQFAEALSTGQQSNSGTAWRIAQDALALAQLAARLDGMRDIGGLVPDAADHTTEK